MNAPPKSLHWRVKRLPSRGQNSAVSRTIHHKATDEALALALLVIIERWRHWYASLLVRGTRTSVADTDPKLKFLQIRQRVVHPMSLLALSRPRRGSMHALVVVIVVVTGRSLRRRSLVRRSRAARSLEDPALGKELV